MEILMDNHRGEVTRAPHGSCKNRAMHWTAACVILLLGACATVPDSSRAPEQLTSSPVEVPLTPTIRPTHTRSPQTATAPVPTNTPTPAPTNTSPPAAPTPSPAITEPVIHSFRVSVDLADPGDTVTLTWQWSGPGEATIYHLLPTGQLSLPNWRVGPTGSLQVTISPERRNYDTFVLYVHDDHGVAAQKTAQIELRCPDEWFFRPAPDICPAGPPTETDGAEQHFQHGVMLWVQADDRIYVLFDDDQYARWSAFTDDWEESQPVLDPSIDPPPGLRQPVRGFGLVWREESTVRERLGWAVDEERGYRAAVQRTSHYRYSDLYVRALDGGVWKLGPNGSAWDHLNTEQ